MDLAEAHPCLLTPMTIVFATQSQPGSAVCLTGLYLGPVHPRNTVLSADLRSAAALPPAHQPASPSTAGNVDFETLAALQGLLDVVRFVREKYARSLLCVHLRTDSELAFQAWNDWIPRWEGTAVASSSSRGWPQLPQHAALATATAETTSSSGLVSAHNGVASMASSSEDVTETGSMFTALSSYSLQHSDRSDSADISPKSKPISLEPPPSLPPQSSAAVAAAATSTDVSAIPAAPPATSARIPRQLTASTYSAAYPLLRALAVLHRLFAHDNEDAFTPEHQWNGRIRLTLSRLPPGRINAASELIAEEVQRDPVLRAPRRNSSGATATGNTPISDSRKGSGIQQQPFNITTVSWLRTPSQAEKQEEAERIRALVAQRLAVQREIELKQAAQHRFAGGRLNSVPAAFWKRRPSAQGGGNGDTVDSVFERSQFAADASSSSAVSGTAGIGDDTASFNNSRTKTRRGSFSSATLLSTSSATASHPVSEVPISPPHTNPTSPDATVLAQGGVSSPAVHQRAWNSMALANQLGSPVSDNDAMPNEKPVPRPPSPVNALSRAASLRRKPVPDLLPAPKFGDDQETAAQLDSGGSRRPSELGLDFEALSAQSSMRPSLERSVSGSAVPASDIALPNDVTLKTVPVAATAPTTPTPRVLTFVEPSPTPRHKEGTEKSSESPHRRAISAEVNSLPAGPPSDTSARKRASTVTNSTVVAHASRNLIVFPSGGAAAAGAGDADSSKQAWRWADPKHRNATQRALGSNSGNAAHHLENRKKDTSVSDIATAAASGLSWPAWKWATPQQANAGLGTFAPGYFMTAASTQHRRAHDGASGTGVTAAAAAAGPGSLFVSSRASSRRASPSPSPVPLSISEAAYRARVTERYDAASRAASPFGGFETHVAISALRRESPPSPLFQDIIGAASRSRTRTSSIISTGSTGLPSGTTAAGYPAAPPSTGSSGRSGLAGNWKWSSESQTHLERQKARAEELAASRSNMAGAPGGLSPLSFMFEGQQPSMGSRRSSAASGGNIASSSLFSTSPPYSSATGGGGPGTHHTGLTQSAANSSAAPSPSPGKPPTLTLHEAYGLHTTAQLRAHRHHALKRQRSIPKLSDVPDTTSSSALGHHGTVDEAEEILAARSPHEQVSLRRRPELAAHGSSDLLEEEQQQGSPLAAAAAAHLALERHLLTAAWTASIAPLTQVSPDEPPPHDRLQPDSGGGAGGLSDTSPCQLVSYETSRRAAAAAAAISAAAADISAGPSRVGVAKSGNRSRILSSLKRPSIPLAESSTALGSKLALRSD
ncbi:hypothetical protein V8E36_001738 [Tilletia maclaganii]